MINDPRCPLPAGRIDMGRFYESHYVGLLQLHVPKATVCSKRFWSFSATDPLSAHVKTCCRMLGRRSATSMSAKDGANFDVYQGPPSRRKFR